MENFFIEDAFYSDLEDFMSARDIDEEGVAELEDDYSVEAEESNLEKAFQFTEENIVYAIIDFTDRFEDRLPEDPDRILEKVKAAVKSGIDVAKINEKIPSLYYPNGKKFNITKADLIAYCF